MPRRKTRRCVSCGNAGAVESVESQKQASPSFHEPLGNLTKRRRDSHISTAPAARGGGKEGTQKKGFPLFPRAPWKSHQKAARFPHFHSSGGEGGWKSGKPKAGFPLSHRPECIWISRRKTEPRASFALRPAAGAPRRLRVKR